MTRRIDGFRKSAGGLGRINRNHNWSPAATMDPSELAIVLRELHGSGCWFSASLSAPPPIDFLPALGPLILSRDRASHRDLVVYSRASAPLASMSARTGEDGQP